MEARWTCGGGGGAMQAFRSERTGILAWRSKGGSLLAGMPTRSMRFPLSFR